MPTQTRESDSVWVSYVKAEKRQPYFQQLEAKLQKEAEQGAVIYPSKNSIFKAFDLTPYASIKVVILGQDPYHGAGQAHGLSFSVPKGVPLPPSLKNIFKCLAHDLGKPFSPAHGNLSSWAEQGVLLLNSVLTVQAHQAHAHGAFGWETFTDGVIKYLNKHEQPLVFLLWGRAAQQKASLIDNPKHLLLKAPHPSPLSAHRGFLTCRHFSQANAWLSQHGRTCITWESVLA